MSLEPILTPDQLSIVDSASGSMYELIERAGWQVARHARLMMGGTYGRRVVVIAGKGNNGADGKVAARWLGRWGSRVEVLEPHVKAVPRCDLVIDAAFGTGFRGSWDAPRTEAPILAVDIATGLDPLVGSSHGGYHVDRTLTFGAWKPGLLFGAGPARSGRVVVATIGVKLDVVDPEAWLWTDTSCLGNLHSPASDHHKWTNAVRVIAGSPGMEGAAAFVTAAALRSGAGMVVTSRPDGEALTGLPPSAVQRTHGADWVEEVLGDIGRFQVAVVGPGVGTGPEVASQVRKFVSACPIPVVIDADGLRAVGKDLSCLTGRTATTVLTPHDGEFEAITTTTPSDRISQTRQLASDTNAVVLLKGPSTVVADPSGTVAVVTSGDARLATAGTGDVLSGVIAANMTSEPLSSVASAAHWHGRAGSRCEPFGAAATDVIDNLGATRLDIERTSS